MTRKTRTLCHIVAAVAAALFMSSALAAEPKPFREVGVEEFIDLMESRPDILLLDVRLANQREAFRIKNSIGIPVESLESRVGELDLGRPMIVFCRTSNRMQEAVRILKPRNPAELIGFNGGMDAVLRFLTYEKQNLESAPEKKKYYDSLRKHMESSMAIIGLMIPEAKLTDGAGKVVYTTAFAGKPAVFAFFYAPEAQQYEAAMAAAAEFGKAVPDVRFIPVAVAEDEASARSLAAKHAAAHKGVPLYFDLGAPAASMMGIQSLPYHMITDAQGVLRVDGVASASGPLDNYRDSTLIGLAQTVASGDIPAFPVSEMELSAQRQDKLVGRPAPDFTLPDLKGEKHSLRELAGKEGVQLIFGTLGCPYTVKHLVAVAGCGKSSASPGGFKVIAVLPGNNFQDAEQAKKFASQNNINYPILIDATGESFKSYAISSVPVWWIIGADGIVKQRQLGFSESACVATAQALGR
jgi:peroxiredoxin/rhodanese-related sulfurtransferase